jgi:outer membrane protein OmpA-like peptidoglycan-associated protein
VKHASRLALLLACGPALAQGAGQQANFVACPLLRDTTPNCWIARSGGETYFIGAQRGPNDSYLPQMKHQVLVEGVVTDEPRVCGGIVMRPLRVSVLPELDASCDGPVLPADGLTPPALPARGSTPSAAPPSDVLGPVGSFMRTPVPLPPFTNREFRIDFDFGTDILTDQMQRRVIETLTYGVTAGAKAYVIRGYPAATLLSNGQVLEEAARLGEQRARKMADLFANLGAPRERLQVEWASTPEPPDSGSGASRRRVTVVVVVN